MTDSEPSPRDRASDSAPLRDLANLTANPLNEAPDELTAFLGPGTTVIGTFSFAGNVRIDGTVEGELLGGRLVVLGPTAHVTGVIRAQVVIVLGARVEASITASRGIELRNAAVVRGDLVAPRVHMDPNIQLEGRCELRPLEK